MIDRTFSMNIAIATGLWVLVGLLLASAWLVMLVGDWHVAAMLGFTSCVSCGLAVTGQFRCYTMRLCAMLRAAAGLQIEDGGELHSFRKDPLHSL